MIKNYPYPPWCPLRYMNHRIFHQQPNVLNCKDGYIYTVVPGDTMHLISRRFNVSLDALLKANPQVTDPSLIYPGMKICVPADFDQIPLPEPPECEQGILYTVKAGDNIYALASRYNLAPRDIVRANPQLLNPNFLIPGQQLCIPLPIPEPPECIGGYLYTIERGDSLSKIASKYDLTVQDIVRSNPQIEDQNVLFVNQKICIPLPIPVPNCTEGVIYTVTKGESLKSIAEKFNINLNTIMKLNPQIVNPDLIFPGQDICVPG